MASTDDYISMTLRVENEQYHLFHRNTEDRGVEKTWVLRKLIELYNKTPSIVHVLEASKRVKA